MRRITLWALSTLTTLVLLFSYHTSTSSAGTPVASAVGSANGSAAANGATTPSNSGSGSTGSGSTGSGSTSSGSSAPSTPQATPSPKASTTATKTYDGTAVMTPYGAVQVEITVANGKITKANVIQVPWNAPRDQEINSQAVPMLNDEVVQKQSAGIDMVSGATFTSDGYIQSLQSAIDQAHL